ncbi:MAG: TIGR03564 family F420-dependent LLM class oxidoreductase [Actinomycetia bacterium]|nr:TIGR03564 family F420-dependent LLM class oxidoreductase [Actinomycetes bacterium]
MNLGIFYGAAGTVLSGDDLVADVQAATDAGFGSYWVPHLPWGADALTSLAIAGREVPDIELGTAVVPTWPRHPLTLAQQALTTAALIGDRLALGIGLAHKPVVEGMWGIPFDKPIRHAREYLEILAPSLRNEQISYSGETLTGRGTAIMTGVPAPKLYVAALGPQMLKLSARYADGTILWMTGKETVRNHTVPVMREAAEEAGRPRPRIIAGIPILCTDDVQAGRELAAEQFAVYGTLPSYRAMLDREGLEGPADFAAPGSEDEVAEQLQALADAGVDDIICSEFGPDPARTRACLSALV